MDFAMVPTDCSDPVHPAILENRIVTLFMSEGQTGLLTILDFDAFARDGLLTSGRLQIKVLAGIYIYWTGKHHYERIEFPLQ